MTENEAIEKLKNMRLFMQLEDKNNEHKFAENDYKANEMAIQTLEKQIAKKPRFYASDYYCSVCGNLVGNSVFEWRRFKYCDTCGQKLDWSREQVDEHE